MNAKPVTIETSTKCSCGGSVLLIATEAWQAHRWRARCGSCYDPTSGAGERSNLVGLGVLPEDALLLWEEQHDEVIAEAALPEWVGDLALQISDEANAQRGWVKSRVLLVDADAHAVVCELRGPGRAA